MQLTTTTASAVVIATAMIVLILSVKNVHRGRCSSALLPLFTVKSEMVSSAATHNRFSFVIVIHQKDVHYYNMNRVGKGDYFKNNSPA